ncbi:MAG: deoxyribonuclease IV [Calditrichaeota bacterium]|nr:MAG: deoxyribonuclease IV [Calditrichota bacterium]MBL1207899.1 deoxyribonuclease IV [Calditrichota bacterium]NOG47734.1 deoxyribonuclease IV [Calditrichota bacterium]
MKYIGAHVSSSGGVENAPLNAKEIEAKAFALFVKNQRQWFVKPLTTESIDGFKKNCEELKFDMDYVLPHDSYLINLGSPDPDGLEKSRNSFLKEIQRCEQLGIKMLNFHPGSHLKRISEEECLDRIGESLNMMLDKTTGVTLLIENTAGQGSNMGYKFEHLAHIIDIVEDKSRIGVCIDTCHTFGAGYELRNEDGFNKTFKTFEDIVGIEYLKGIHLNDSKKEFASRLDRHESIGDGLIGIDAFRFIMNDPRFEDMPIILETPNPERWAEEIKMLYSMIN